MPRRKQQFSFLSRALKANGNEGTPGSVLGEFKNFKAGINKRKAGAIPADARKRLQYGILPFGKDIPGTITDKDYYQVKISKWSNTWRVGGAGLSNADVGYEAGKTTHTSVGNFYPAMMMATVFEGTPQPKTSGITKREYKARVSKSYSIPFGCHATKAGQSTYMETREALSAKAVTAGASSITYVPEQWTSPDKTQDLGT